jgi:transcriptional regulator with XRE-family HTH domain
MRGRAVIPSLKGLQVSSAVGAFESARRVPREPGARIAEARRRLGLNQKHFAEKLGISLWTIDQLERDRRDALPHLGALTRATGLDAESLGISAQLPETAEVKARGSATPARAFGVGRVASGRHLVLGSIALLVLVRFFTEVMPIVPRAANFIDIPIFVLLGAAVMTQTRENQRGRSYMPVALPAVLFLWICALSALVNLSRVAPGPVLVFIYGFLAPLGVYAAVYRLWPSGNARSASRLVFALGVVQLLVVLTIDLPRFVASGDPDQITGTFGTNAYQLVFFLLLFTALLAGIFTIERGRWGARAAPVLVVLTLASIFLAQYRALLATTAASLLLVAILLSPRGRGLVAAVVLLASFVVTLSFIAAHFPQLRLTPVITTFQGKPGYYASKKLGVMDDVLRLYSDHPTYVLTGSGPGTYSSRAWETFANIKSSSRSNVQGTYVSALTGGKAYRSDVADKYVLPAFRGAAVIQGSHQLSSPFFDYVSLLAEVGMVGFFAIVALYVAVAVRVVRQTARVIRRAAPGDPLPALFVACSVAFTVLLQMGFLENWLEVTRLTFVSWALLAVAQKELDGRET